MIAAVKLAVFEQDRDRDDSTAAPSEPSRTAPDLGSSIEDFLRYMGAIRNCSPNTIKSYRTDLLDAVGHFCSCEGTAECPVDYLTAASLRSYQAQISKRKIKATTICRKIVAIRSFCRWMTRQGRLEDDPSIGLRGPRCPSPVPRFMTYEDVSKLLSAPNHKDPLGSRDGAILHTLYSAGLRVGELVGLDLADVDLGECLLKVRRGKGKKDRWAIIGPPAVEAISRWLPFRERMARISCADAAALYLNCDSQRLAARSVVRVFRKYADAAGVSKLHSPHSLRHTFSSHLLANGADLASIKDLMGHASLQSTCRYANLAPPQMRQVLEHHHPRA